MQWNWKTGKRTGIALALLFASTVFADTDFFAPGFDSGKNLPADKIYPQGRVFPYSGFSPGDLIELKKTGFTMAGPVYTEKQLSRLLSDAEKADMPILYTLHPSVKGAPLTRQILDRNDFDPADYVSDLKRTVRKMAKNRRIAWWYLAPEELRPWRTRDMNFLKQALAAIRASDPLKRPVWLYLPNHYTAKQMTPFAETLDILGKGMYPSQLGKERERIWCRWSTESEVEAVGAAGNRSIPIAVPEMFRQPPAELVNDVEKWVRHDVYLSLISGARGIVVFSLARRSNFDAHSRYFKAYAQIGRELTDGKLGEAFLFGKSMNTLKITPLNLKAEKLTVHSGHGVSGEKNDYSPVTHLELGYRDERLLFLVNSSPTDMILLRIEGLPQETLQILDRFSGREITIIENGRFAASLLPYEVRGFHFVRKK